MPDTSVLRWSSGDHVVFRQVWPGGVWAAIPATIIEDSSALVSLYIAPGAMFSGPNCAREEYLHVAAGGAWERKLYEWTGQHHVWASVPGEACSVWTIWSSPDWTHLGWKVNPETPSDVLPSVSIQRTMSLTWSSAPTSVHGDGRTKTSLPSRSILACFQLLRRNRFARRRGAAPASA